VDSPQGGKDGYNITTEVISGDKKGRKVFHTFWVSPDSEKAMQFFFRNMSVLGLPRAWFINNNPSDEQILARLEGAKFQGTIGLDKGANTPRNEIRFFDELPVDANDPFAAPPAGGAPSGLPTTAAPTTSVVSPIEPTGTPVGAPEPPF
jgi:hypothetical protein